MENRFVYGLGLGKKIMVCAVAALAVLIPAIGQKGSRFTFEVASVKPAPERDYGTMSRPTGMAPAIEGDPAQITFTDVTLVGVICRAYGVRALEVKAPGWMQDLKYDIHAKVPAGAPKGHILEMLQNLLTDRLQLKLHWESHDQPGYILAPANGGPKLKPQTSDAPRSTAARSIGRFELRHSAPNTRRMSNTLSNGHFEFYRITMDEFAHALSGNLGKPVVDNTRMPGEYDIVYDAAPDSLPGFLKYFPQGQQESEFPTIFAALRQLGLNLTPAPKVAKRYLVVDSALKTPTEN